MAESIRILDSQKNHIDSLPLTQEEPFTLETFGNLITAYRNQSKNLIIARVETEIPPKNPTDSPERRYFYYEANSLNKLILRKFGEYGNYFLRLCVMNPLTNTEMVGDVHYFLVDVEEKGKGAIMNLQSTPAHALKPSGSANSSQLLNANKMQSLNDNLLQRSLEKADIKIAEIVGTMSKKALAEQASRSTSDVNSTKPSFSGPGSLNESGLISPAVRSLLMEYNTYKMSNNSSDVDFDKWVNSKTATSLQALRNKQQSSSTNVSPINPLHEGDSPSWKVTIRRKSLQNKESQKNITAAVGNTAGELSSGLLASSLRNQQEQQVSNISLVSNRSPATLAVESATAVPVQSESVSTPRTSAISPDTSAINFQIPAERYKAQFIGTDDDYLNRAAIRRIFSANGLHHSELYDVPNESLLNEGIIVPDMPESIMLTEDEYNRAIALGATPPENARSTSCPLLELIEKERIISKKIIEMLESRNLTDDEGNRPTALGATAPENAHSPSLSQLFEESRIITESILEMLAPKKIENGRNRTFAFGATAPETTPGWLSFLRKKR
ncbi:hypothetical protein BKA69DRAFT_1174162 [Paraphysoderma sedebokerense]|nr:hypothetical protein BKA69DRAFT_1174162 [Paraphysoderma sedebokerense]